MALLELNDLELDTLLRVLLRLYQTSKDKNIQRTAKSLFTLLSRNRFSPSNSEDIIF